MTKELITNGNIIIAENPEFVLMPNSLDEKQLHLLLLLVAQVHPDDKEFNWVSVDYDTLIKRYNHSNKYGMDSIVSMKNSIYKLAQKLWKNDKGDFCHYIDKGKFDDENRIAKLKLSDEVIYFFLIYERALFSKYGYIKDLRTKCAMQLYRFCNLKKNFNNTISIKTDEAIKLFYNDEKTIKTNDFIRKHLEPAIERINTFTDLHVEYEKIYNKNDKRKISSLKFTIIKNEDREDFDEWENFDLDYGFIEMD